MLSAHYFESLKTLDRAYAAILRGILGICMDGWHGYFSSDAVIDPTFKPHRGSDRIGSNCPIFFDGLSKHLTTLHHMAKKALSFARTQNPQSADIIA